MFYVYILQILQSLKDRKLYIGYTSNLKRRLKEHKTGGSFSTKKRLPFRLLYYEAHSNEKDARRRERYFKTQKGKSTLKQMLREALKNFSF
jgi:putative endonuclease